MGKRLWFPITLLLCLCVATVSADGRGTARGVVNSVHTDQPWIALTFDDGPDPKETPAILDVLKKYGAQATFFVIGEQGRSHPDLLRRETAEGHEIANHTFRHQHLFRKSEADILEEIQHTDEEIAKATGRHAKLFRPPGGVINERIVRSAEAAGYTVVIWTWYQDSKDWKRPGAEAIAKKVVEHAHPGDIVLLHDRISGRSQTAAALELILPQLKKAGYRFVTVSKLLASEGVEVPPWTTPLESEDEAPNSGGEDPKTDDDGPEVDDELSDD